MRILVDYRPALRQRTGVGEYIHEAVRALARRGSDEITIFTSSWKDRPPPRLSEELGVDLLDSRIPGKALNALWHRTGWPPVEWLGAHADVVHAAHPLLIPSTTAAQIVTVHDLFFLTDPDSVAAEIRRDYPGLAREHAQRAHAIITSSAHGKRELIERLSADPARVYVVPPGAPAWRNLGRAPNLPAAGYALFVGTAGPRKNLHRLLEAWALVRRSSGTSARLVLAGGLGPSADGLTRRLRDSMADGVEHLGYVPDSEREALYAGARLLVLPSLEEGFGLPVLEAMSAGVPVVASHRGAIPEVSSGAALLVEPDDVDDLAEAMTKVLSDEGYARALATRGLERARDFSWERSAALLADAYADALARRRSGGARA